MDTNQDGRKRIVFGVDWGVKEDQSVIAVLDASNSQLIDVIRHNLKGFYDQRGVIVNLYEQWQPSSIWVESNSIGAPNIEALQVEGLPARAFFMTAKNKKHLLAELLYALDKSTTQAIITVSGRPDNSCYCSCLVWCKPEKFGVEMKEQIEAMLLGNKWTFAKTMPTNPHEYTLRKNWENDLDFIKAVQFIRDNGYSLSWWGRLYTCYDLDGKRYWTMGDPMETTRLINRADNVNKLKVESVLSGQTEL